MNFTKITLTKTTLLITVTTSILLASCSSMGGMKMKPPMGSAQDVTDANNVWQALKSVNLVGNNRKKSHPYKGQHPHGAVLETLHETITVDGHTGLAIVKRNYGGKGISNASVAQNRTKYLKAVTVMFKRESGYNSDNEDWFWAKYKTNGGLHVKEMKNGMKIKLAGRVAKGMPSGCISCHKAAGGGDYVFADKIKVN
ncbi:hypothetical protein MNBD_GAMMA22-101 [hydrothermal vent metagenome]|uniref:Cytochrome P460 domain-containing protein n=1 Tax=hydrothermal vent metagenome TaxID=652676 RepID=A0A3B1A3H8_9ZZZZ